MELPPLVYLNYGLISKHYGWIKSFYVNLEALFSTTSSWAWWMEACLLIIVDLLKSVGICL